MNAVTFLQNAGIELDRDGASYTRGSESSNAWLRKLQNSQMLTPIRMTNANAMSQFFAAT
jgi:hypothetical protein